MDNGIFNVSYLIAAILFAASMFFFIAIWFATRSTKTLMPTDLLSAAILLLFGPIVLFNPLAINSLYLLPFDYNHASRALYILSTMYVFLGLGFLVAFEVFPRPRFKSIPNLLSTGLRTQGYSKILTIAIVCAVAIVAIGLTNPSLKFDVIRFLSGTLDSGEYKYLRRVVHNTKDLNFELLSRLRYSLMPAVMILLLFLFLEKKKYFWAFASFGFIFLFGPSMLSKQVYAFYFIYLSLTIIVVFEKHNWLNLKNLLIFVPIGFVVILSILTVLYILQYPQLFPPEKWGDAIYFSFYRIGMLPYEGLLKYATIYPEERPFAGFGFSRITAGILDIPVRDTTLEVGRYYSGTDSQTSVTTLFVAASYSAFGLYGVAAFSFLIAIYLRGIEAIIMKIQRWFVRIPFYICYSVNVLFLLQIAPLTAMLSYGIATIPIFYLLINWVSSEKKSQTLKPFPATMSRR